MAQQIPTKQQDFSGGMCDVNVTLAPTNTVSLLLNMDADTEVGSATSRLGNGLIGGLVAGNPVLGLHQHVDLVTPANNKLFGTINASGGATSVIYDVIAGTTTQTGLTASAKMRFLTFNGATLAINGADAERSYTSAGWITTGGAFDLANIPSSNTVNLCIDFLSRVYLAGDSSQPTRLYYSGLSDGSTVSWTSGNGYVDIEPKSSAGKITALAKVPGYVLIFKERSMHRWNFSSAFPESLIQIGTPNQESVVMGGGLCAFFSISNENARGFYITNGGRPVCISGDNNRPIKRWIDAMSSTSQTRVAGWATDRGFAWSVGDITLDGETFTNVVLRYNRLLNQWSVRTYPQEYRVFATYDSGSSTNTTVAGGDDGVVYQMDKPNRYVDATSSANPSFPWKVRQQHLTYGENRKKNIDEKIVVRGKNLESARVSVIVNEDVLNPIPVAVKGVPSRSVSEFGISQQISGNTISVEVSGESNGSQSIVREIELPSVNIDKNHV